MVRFHLHASVYCLIYLYLPATFVEETLQDLLLLVWRLMHIPCIMMIVGLLIISVIVCDVNFTLLQNQLLGSSSPDFASIYIFRGVREELPSCSFLRGIQETFSPSCTPAQDKSALFRTYRVFF